MSRIRIVEATFYDTDGKTCKPDYIVELIVWWRFWIPFELARTEDLERAKRLAIMAIANTPRDRWIRKTVMELPK